MAFDPDNLTFCLSLEIKIKSNYILYGNQLESLEEAKYIALIIRQDAEANNTLCFLRRNFNISSTSVKKSEQAYTSLINPSFEYGCAAWAAIIMATSAFKPK